MAQCAPLVIFSKELTLWTQRTILSGWAVGGHVIQVWPWWLWCRDSMQIELNPCLSMRVDSAQHESVWQWCHRHQFFWHQTSVEICNQALSLRMKFLVWNCTVWVHILTWWMELRIQPLGSSLAMQCSCFHAQAWVWSTGFCMMPAFSLHCVLICQVEVHFCDENQWRLTFLCKVGRLWASFEQSSRNCWFQKEVPMDHAFCLCKSLCLWWDENGEHCLSSTLQFLRNFECSKAIQTKQSQCGIAKSRQRAHTARESGRLGCHGWSAIFGELIVGAPLTPPPALQWWLVELSSNTAVEVELPPLLPSLSTSLWLMTLLGRWQTIVPFPRTSILVVVAIVVVVAPTRVFEVVMASTCWRKEWWACCCDGGGRWWIHADGGVFFVWMQWVVMGEVTRFSIGREPGRSGAVGGARHYLRLVWARLWVWKGPLTRWL